MSTGRSHSRYHAGGLSFAGRARRCVAGQPPAPGGLYACLFSGLVFWLFCSSRHTAISVTSAISLLVGASLGEISGGDPSRFGALAAGTALLVAFIALVAWAVRAGAIVNFISESVMVGFKCGVALFSCEHTAAETARHFRVARRFLAELKSSVQPSERNQSRFLDHRACGSRSAHPGKALIQAQASGSLRGDRRHPGLGALGWMHEGSSFWVRSPRVSPPPTSLRC